MHWPPATTATALMMKTAWCSQAVVVGNGRYQVTASTQGYLNAWFDWNADGDWDDAGEHVFVDRILVPGANQGCISHPAKAWQTAERSHASASARCEPDL
jgi:hypothetical protein